MTVLLRETATIFISQLYLQDLILETNRLGHKYPYSFKPNFLGPGKNIIIFGFSWALIDSDVSKQETHDGVTSLRGNGVIVKFLL